MRAAAFVVSPFSRGLPPGVYRMRASLHALHDGAGVVCRAQESSGAGAAVEFKGRLEASAVGTKHARGFGQG